MPLVMGWRAAIAAFVGSIPKFRNGTLLSERMLGWHCTLRHIMASRSGCPTCPGV